MEGTDNNTKASGGGGSSGAAPVPETTLSRKRALPAEVATRPRKQLRSQGAKEGGSQAPTPAKKGAKVGSQPPTPAKKGTTEGGSQPPTPAKKGTTEGGSQPPTPAKKDPREGGSKLPSPAKTEQKGGVWWRCDEPCCNFTIDAGDRIRAQKKYAHLQKHANWNRVASAPGQTKLFADKVAPLSKEAAGVVSFNRAEEFERIARERSDTSVEDAEYVSEQVHYSPSMAMFIASLLRQKMLCEPVEG
jgi:hypothetical protein